MAQTHEEFFRPLIKWPGGKEQELNILSPLFPSFHRYYEPFVGGGAVFFWLKSHVSFINDRASELIQFYTMLTRQDTEFFYTLDSLLGNWRAISDLIDANAGALVRFYTMFRAATGKLDGEVVVSWLDAFLSHHQCIFSEMCLFACQRTEDIFFSEIRRNLLNKTQRMRQIELRKGLLTDHDILLNLECAFKSAFYMYLRHLYNYGTLYDLAPGVASALFYFVRENAYASMFRYNASGAMNVPYGGVSYNRKDLARKVALLRSPTLHAYLRTTVIENLDFEDFLNKYPPQVEDFVFIDPPYDSNFNTYQRNRFGPQEQGRLANYLLRHCRAKFLLVVKDTPLIRSLYDRPGWQMRSFEKQYPVNFQNRNERRVQHVIITNY